MAFSKTASCRGRRHESILGRTGFLRLHNRPPRVSLASVVAHANSLVKGDSMSETDKVLSVADIAAMLKQDGENVVVLTVGVPGSRKSTLAAALKTLTPFI